MQRVFVKALFFVGVLSMFLLPVAHAQTATPQFLLTWRTSGSYVPSFYIGKAIPSFGSQITAAVELVSNGKILNISGQTIYWYLNDTQIGGGAGQQSITFTPFDVPPNSQNLKVSLPLYDGGLSHQIEINTVTPEAVIFAPYPANQASTNPIVVKALPYFFNTSSTSNLSYSWAVNGQTGSNTENPDEADINLPPGTPSGMNLAVSLTITNPVGGLTAQGSTNLVYQQTP